MFLLYSFSCFCLWQYHQLPAERVERKELPPEHQGLKTTFEGLVQRCSAVATDPVSPPFSGLWLFLSPLMFDFYVLSSLVRVREGKSSPYSEVNLHLPPSFRL